MMSSCFLSHWRWGRAGKGGVLCLKGAALKRASPISQGKPRMNPILGSIPFGCNITDILQEIAYSLQEDSGLKVVQWVPELFLIRNTLFKEILWWNPKQKTNWSPAREPSAVCFLSSSLVLGRSTHSSVTSSWRRWDVNQALHGQ